MNTLAPSHVMNRRTVRSASTAPRRWTGWLIKLAAWAERQPRHRRLGSWTQL